MTLYPQLTPDFSDEESHYGVIGGFQTVDKRAPFYSPEPQQLYEKRQDEQIGLDIGWVVKNMEFKDQEKDKQHDSNLDNILNKATKSHTSFRNFLIILSILEIIFVFLLLLPIVNKAHNLFACAAIFSFKLALIARHCWSGTVLNECKSLLTGNREDGGAKTDDGVKADNCDTESTDGSEADFQERINEFGARTVKFRRGENGKFGIHHMETSITRVDVESLARIRGVKRGDQIIFVNGIDIETLSHDDISKLFERVSGPVVLTLRYNPRRLQELENHNLIKIN